MRSIAPFEKRRRAGGGGVSSDGRRLGRVRRCTVSPLVPSRLLRVGLEQGDHSELIRVPRRAAEAHEWSFQ